MSSPLAGGIRGMFKIEYIPNKWVQVLYGDSISIFYYRISPFMGFIVYLIIGFRRGKKID